MPISMHPVDFIAEYCANCSLGSLCLDRQRLVSLQGAVVVVEQCKQFDPIGVSR